MSTQCSQWSKQKPLAQSYLRLWGEGGPRSWRTLIAQPQRVRCSEAAFFQLPKYRLSWNRKAADTGTPEAGTCQPVHMSHADSVRSVSGPACPIWGGVLNPICQVVAYLLWGLNTPPPSCLSFAVHFLFRSSHMGKRHHASYPLDITYGFQKVKWVKN